MPTTTTTTIKPETNTPNLIVLESTTKHAPMALCPKPSAHVMGGLLNHKHPRLRYIEANPRRGDMAAARNEQQ